MTRHGYSDDIEDTLAYGRWRAQVQSAIRGKRGQAFLKELAAAMDAMPEKVLIAEELIDCNGDCCTIGVVCKARGLDVRRNAHRHVRRTAVRSGDQTGTTYMGRTPCKVYFDSTVEPPIRIELPEKKWIWPK